MDAGREPPRSWDDLLSTSISDFSAAREREALLRQKREREERLALRGKKPEVEEAPPREQLPWDLRLAEKADFRNAALADKWERAAELRLARSEAFFDHVAAAEARHAAWTVDLFEQERQRDLHLDWMKEEREAKRLLQVRRQTRRANEQAKQRKEIAREKFAHAAEREAGRQERLLSRRAEWEEHFRDGPAPGEGAFGPTMDQLEEHRQMREMEMQNAEQLILTNQRRILAYRRKLQAAMTGDPDSPGKKNATDFDRAAQERAERRLERQERTPQKKLLHDPVKTLHREEFRVRVEQHHAEFHAEQRAKAGESWAQRGQDLDELIESRMSSPNKWTDDLKRRTKEGAARRDTKQRRFKESQAKLNETFLTQTSRMSASQTETMERHDHRRKSREDRRLEKLKDSGRKQVEKTQASIEFVEDRRQQRAEKQREREVFMQGRFDARAEAALDALTDSSAAFDAKVFRYGAGKARRNARFMALSAHECERKELQVEHKKATEKVTQLDRVRGWATEKRLEARANAPKKAPISFTEGDEEAPPPMPDEPVVPPQTPPSAREVFEHTRKTIIATLGDLYRTIRNPPKNEDEVGGKPRGARKTLRESVQKSATPESSEHESPEASEDESPESVDAEPAPSAPEVLSLEELEKWCGEFFSFMDVNSNGRVSMGDFVSSLDVLNVEVEPLIGMTAKNAYRYLSDRDGFMRRKKFMLNPPEAAAPSPMARPDQSPAAPSPAPPHEQEDPDDVELEAYLETHGPEDPPDCDAHVHEPPDSPSQQAITQMRMHHSDTELIMKLENPKREAQYTCGNGLDYLARKRDGFDAGSAMLWVFTHSNKGFEAQPLRD